MGKTALSWIKILTICGLLQSGFIFGDVPIAQAATPSVQTGPDGSRIIQENGATIQILRDGTKIIKKRNGTVIQVNRDKSKIIQKANGTVIQMQPNGTKIIKKPDGSVIQVNPNGTTVSH